jgi:uncharacterized membrane protein YdjX (TVP38/TMEM64 family)
VTHTRVRQILTALWIVGASAAVFVYVARREWLEDILGGASGSSFAAGAAVYLALGCLRAFTLIPVTSLVLLGIVFFDPQPLFWLTLAGILVSSTCVYYFAEALHLDEVLTHTHRARLTRIRALLERYGLPIIIGWSFFPFVPTDLICYLAGVIKLRLSTLLIGVATGEGAVCAIYIFLGDSLLRALGLR